ncbi:unnamed protein product [Oikopleura dioica]|uniref:Uncharacterized protein BAC001.28 n=1 Tax=Oikopleura dioica TaxID=34765 RepID=Q8WPK4_OIKDI|nr:putative protein [Oikopleura dioica]CBY14303.1 unnamed protein product [Oikopleura dioica]CBY19225.1 unnamed protein product [Oikopleura dioica]
MAKAKKSINKKNSKAIRKAIVGSRKSTIADDGVQCAPKDFSEDSEWEIEAFGGLYLVWGKKKIRNADGSIKRQYYLKKDSEHRIWVKWTVAFHDKIRWSAEKQEMFTKRDEVSKIVNEKKAWPLPSIKDGTNTGWKERKAIAIEFGITEWKSNEGDEKNKKYNLIDPELPVTQSEIEDTDEETDEETD